MLSEIGSGKFSLGFCPEYFFRGVEEGEYDGNLVALIASFETLVSLRQQINAPVHIEWDLNNLEYGLNLLRSRYEDIYRRRQRNSGTGTDTTAISNGQ